MELYYIGRKFDGTDGYEMVAICDGDSDVDKVKMLAKNISGVYSSWSSNNVFSLSKYHSVQFDGKHLNTVMTFLADETNKRKKDKKYVAFLTSTPDKIHIFYTIHIRISNDVGNRLICDLRGKRGFISYEFSGNSGNTDCWELDMKFANPYAVTESTKVLKGFGIDVTDIQMKLLQHFNDILQTQGGEN